MGESKKLNIELRGIVLQISLRNEDVANEIMKVLLRIVKSNTKTLSNKSSSLSYKNKIDLLYDLLDLTDLQYNHLVKAMEIRNQFMHNYECASFAKLQEFNPDLTKYLKKHFPNEINDEEESLKKSFIQMFVINQGKLLQIKKEYEAGIVWDYDKYSASETMQAMEVILTKVADDWKKEYADKLPEELVVFTKNHIELILKKAHLQMREYCFDTMKKIIDDPQNFIRPMMRKMFLNEAKERKFIKED